MTKINSFVKQFVAVIKGDDAEALAQKAWRQSQSALKTQIASLEGDIIKFEDSVTDAKEAQESARINGGKPITDRNYYVETLLDSKNTVTRTEKALKDHTAKIDFLKSELKALETEVEA